MAVEPVSQFLASVASVMPSGSAPSPTSSSSFLGTLGALGDTIRAEESAIQDAFNRKDDPMKTMETVLEARQSIDFLRALLKTTISAINSLMQMPL